MKERVSEMKSAVAEALSSLLLPSCFFIIQISMSWEHALPLGFEDCAQTIKAADCFSTPDCFFDEKTSIDGGRIWKSIILEMDRPGDEEEVSKVRQLDLTTLVLDNTVHVLRKGYCEVNKDSFDERFVARDSLVEVGSQNVKLSIFFLAMSQLHMLLVLFGPRQISSVISSISALLCCPRFVFCATTRKTLETPRNKSRFQPPSVAKVSSISSISLIHL